MANVRTIRLAVVGLLSCLLAGIGSAEDLQWTVSSLDPCGYVPAWEVCPKRPSAPQKKALADLLAKRYSQAWVGFRDLYRLDDDSPFHIWGMAISAFEAQALDLAADEVASQATTVRQKELDRGGGWSPPKGTARHIVAFNLIRAMMVRRKERDRLTGRSQTWSSILSFEPLPSEEKRREMIILYSAAMFGMNEHGKSRKWLKAYVDSHPKESWGRLLLAESYSRGVVRMVDGQGKELPVPPEDRSDQSLARKYAVEAARLEPNSAEAQYVAGWACVVESPMEAGQYLRRYLQLDKNPPKLRKAVIEQFLRTGRWGPPQPPPG